MNKRRIAIEWLYFVGCIVFVTALVSLAVLRGLEWHDKYFSYSLNLVVVLYSVVQGIRLTVWAIRRLKKRP